MWMKLNHKLAITLLWNLLQTNCVSGCRSSLRRCSQEAAVRFTSWLWDRTHCLTGNSWGCYSGINWWCLPSSLRICRVIFIFSADWCSSPWIRDMTQRPTIVFFFSLNPFLFSCVHIWIRPPLKEESSYPPRQTSWNSTWESCFSLLAATSSAAEVRSLCPAVHSHPEKPPMIWISWQLGKSSWAPGHWSTPGHNFQSLLAVSFGFCSLRSAFGWSLVGRHYRVSAFIVRTQRWSEVSCSFVSSWHMNTHNFK